MIDDFISTVKSTRLLEKLTRDKELNINKNRPREINVFMLDNWGSAPLAIILNQLVGLL